LQNILKEMWRIGPQNKGNSPSILLPGCPNHYNIGIRHVYPTSMLFDLQSLRSRPKFKATLSLSLLFRKRANSILCTKCPSVRISFHRFRGSDFQAQAKMVAHY
jgi:hypothetical protein